MVMANSPKTVASLTELKTKTHSRSPKTKAKKAVVALPAPNDFEYIELANYIVTNKLLGAGPSSRVYKGFSKLNRKDKVAVKIVPLNSAVAAEASLLGQLHHENIIAFRGAEEQGELLYIILDYAPFNLLLLLEACTRMSEDVARGLFGSVLEALRYSHSRGIYHRDIKLANVLLDGSLSVKLADYSLATEAGADQPLTQMCGTAITAAPEVLMGLPYRGSFVDVYSCGVLLYTMLAGTTPFDGDSVTEVIENIKRGQLKRWPRYISAKAKDLILSMMKLHPRSRITIDEALAHPFFDLTEDDQNTTPAGTPLEDGPFPLELMLAAAKSRGAEGAEEKQD